MYVLLDNVCATIGMMYLLRLPIYKMHSNHERKYTTFRQKVFIHFCSEAHKTGRCCYSELFNLKAFSILL